MDAVRGIIFDWLETLYERDKGLFPHVKEVLEYLKPHYKLGLVSIARDGIEKRMKEIKNSGIEGMFDSVIIDVEKGRRQYEQCINEMKLTSKKTAIVDDRTIRGIRIGNELGCMTIWLQKGKYANELPNSETGEPFYTINSIEELETLFE